MRRIISMMLVLCIVFSALTLQPLAAGMQNAERPIAAQNPFSDVKESDWFYEAVMQAVYKEIFLGTGDNRFSPQGTMTRAMYVTVMGRIAEIDPADYEETNEFSDVRSGSWYAPYVQWAKEKGITSGVDGGKFNPDELITLEQMATLTVRFFDAYQITYPESTVADTPKDLDQVSDYAREAVLKLWNCGFLRGDGTGNVNPKKRATRAEAAAFCVRTGEVVEKWFAETGSISSGEEPLPDETPDTDADTGSNNGSGAKNSFAVSFMDGQRLLDRLRAAKGEPLPGTVDNIKTAKEGFIFAGWFTNKECTVPFYSEDPVTSSLTVYAKYEEIQKETLSITSFSQLDQSPDLSFVIQKTGNDAGDVIDSAVLTTMDGTEPAELEFTDNGDDTYTVKAKDGFSEGSSYQLTLGEGYIFKDKAESIRIAFFTIKKEEVDSLALRDDIVFIRDTDEMSYTMGDAAPVDVLEAELLDSKTEDPVTGTFGYSDADELQNNEILCIYETVDPRQRDYVNVDYSDDAEAYVKVISINGTTVSFTSLDETEAEKIVFLPDTIPFSVQEVPTVESGTVQSTDIDNSARSAMGLDANPEVGKGDFVVFYEGEFANLTEDSPSCYGIVTSVDGTTISYRKTSREELEKSMDTFLQQTQKGDQLLEGVDTQALKDKIEEQVLSSGFAENAAEYLAQMATQTQGFQTLSGLKEFSVTDENGNPLTAEELKLMGIGANIELSDNVKVKVELDKSSKYFNDGIRLAVGIEAEFSVDMGEDGELKIELSATFAEEIAIDITASAHADITWFIIVPKFNELSFRTAVDLKNYAGISVDVKMYTVKAEEESVWDKLKGINDGKFKGIIEQIEDVKSKIDQAKETADKINGYKDDLKRLWAGIPANVTNEAEYEGMLDTLGELNVTQELMGMLNLTSKTELDAGVRDLMERYSEMLENESDWIEILHKEIFNKDFHLKCFAIKISASFVIKGNINIALGTNLEYVVGKRYSFWFDIISKTSGNSEMDLLDEKFAFQFYVMGELGLKMGIEAEIAVGIISTKIGSIGVTAEFGPYVEMWGYFIYEYTKLRPANTSTWTYDERMMGALYLEFGLYLEMTFKAQALNNLFKYEPTILDKKWSLLTVGTRNSVYGFAYEIDKDEVLPVRDQDSNSTNGITMQLADTYRLMDYMDLCEGDREKSIYGYEKFNYTLSNRNFAFDSRTGTITVTVPKGVQYMECDLKLTWKTDKLAFSLYDLSVTIPLVWTNLSNEELNERFTASVMVGNAQDGFRTVWSNRVVKNSPFDLPTEDEIKTLLGVDTYETPHQGNLKYNAVTGYGGQQAKGLIILRDTTYYFEVTPREYTLTVRNVESSDGSRSNRQFTAKFGEAFDLRTLAESGTDDDQQKNYTSFLNVTAKDNANNELGRNIAEPVGKAFADEILSGTVYTANYADNSATAIFRFQNIDLDPIEVKMKKGDVPSSGFFDGELQSRNAIVKSITPAFAPITGATAYTVVCEVQEVPIVIRTVTYNSNGGSMVAQGSYAVGSSISAPSAPARTGYLFDGWYNDEALTQAFDFNTMPDEDIILYAGWSGEQYTITFDANEGSLGDGVSDTKSITFGDSYGSLPVPVRAGYSFIGWFTGRSEGERVTYDSVAAVSDDHTLYAHWGTKIIIGDDAITVADQVYDYNGEAYPLVFTVGGIDPESFVVSYKRQNIDSSWNSSAVNAGVYDVKITRTEDDIYDSFEKTFTAVLTISKIGRTITADPTGNSFMANILIDELPENAYPGDGTAEYAVSASATAPANGWQTHRAFMNLPGGSYYLFVRVGEGENYIATESVVSAAPVVVQWVAADAYGYTYAMEIKTSNITGAGTDSTIKGKYSFVDGSESGLVHFDNDGSNDFEKGDTGSYQLPDITADPWMIRGVTIDYDRGGPAPGWHCQYVKPNVYRIINYFPLVIQAYSGETMSVNQWFGAEDHNSSHVVWSGNTDSMKRVITDVGNFAEVADSINLTSGDSDQYTFTYDGLVMDQYSHKDSSSQYTPYNAYEHDDAPLLTITSEDPVYKKCLRYAINSFTIDKAALYTAMGQEGESEITLTVTLQFPERSTTADTATYTKTITVTLGD